MGKLYIAFACLMSVFSIWLVMFKDQSSVVASSVKSNMVWASHMFANVSVLLALGSSLILGAMYLRNQKKIKLHPDFDGMDEMKLPLEKIDAMMVKLLKYSVVMVSVSLITGVFLAHSSWTDGCYRCIRTYRLQYDAERISRERGILLLEDLIKSGEKRKVQEDLESIKPDQVFGSMLARRFVRRHELTSSRDPSPSR